MVLWKTLFSHFVNLVTKHVMRADGVGSMFGSRLISQDSKHGKEVRNFYFTLFYNRGFRSGVDTGCDGRHCFFFFGVQVPFSFKMRSRYTEIWKTAVKGRAL